MSYVFHTILSSFATTLMREREREREREGERERGLFALLHCVLVLLDVKVNSNVHAFVTRLLI